MIGKLIYTSFLLLYVATFSYSQQYHWKDLQKGNVPDFILDKTGFSEKEYKNKPFKYEVILHLYGRIITASENNGYPFAAVEATEIKIEEDSISARLQYTSGPLITYDSLLIVGTDRVKQGWLVSYLNILPGQVYSQRNINAIDDKLATLVFLKPFSPTRITFQNSEARAYLYLKDRPANTADGIIGFAPNSGNGNKLLVTGQAQLSLVNLFGSGKSFKMQWQQLRPASQYLDIQYRHPNLFRSSLSLYTQFELLKEDSTFINRKVALAFIHTMKPHEISLFVRLKSSRLLHEEMYDDTNELELPEISDFDVNYYGGGYSYDGHYTRNDIQMGWGGGLEMSLGAKKIKKSAWLPSQVYEGIDLNTIQYIFEAQVDYYLSLGQKTGVFHKVSGGKLINEQLFTNDFFRVGGLKSLRGVNENFFFASDFALSNLELRLHYEPKSYLFLFYDQAYLYANINQNKAQDYPLGVGAGISFITKAGTVNLAYALGQYKGQPLGFRFSHFHFGYVAKF